MELFIGGGIILVYVAIVFACIYWALRWARQRNVGFVGRIGLVVPILIIAYAIPLGDYSIGVVKFKRLCIENAGARVGQKLDARGFVWKTARQTKPYTTYGYQFFEVLTAKGDIYRYQLRRDGTIYETKVNEPQARYLAYSQLSEIGGDIRQSKFTVLDRETHNELASWTALHYRGGWLFRSLSGIGVTGPTCPSAGTDFVPSVFIKDVLTPEN